MHHNVTKLVAKLLVTSVLVTACNFPTGTRTPDPVGVAATETQAALETLLAAGPPPGQPPTATATVPPQPTLPPPTMGPTTATPTLTPSPTITSIPCNRASFVSDVTIPDGTELAPGASFTKTWRLKNTGSCEWTSSYSLVFDQGDAMGGQAAVQLTTGTVSPGQTVDISVDLTAPSTPGTYKGYWKLRNNSGVVFGIGLDASVAFWVEIEVVPATTTIVRAFIPAESGMVGASGIVAMNNHSVGDAQNNFGLQLFLSFDISAIPAGATITEVIADFTTYSTSGDPFGDLGCLDLFKHDYGSPSADDYTSGSPAGRLIRWCSTGSLSETKIDDDMITALQTKVGDSRFKIRLQFQTEFTNDSQDDQVTFSNAKLTIKYY
jgi:hypothetical protein